jgi:glycerophosphoryl diester phosphodiesterase
MIQSRFLHGSLPLAFAHRGGAGDAPENSLAAFAAAYAIGYRYLETDAHLTADGVVLAFHDDALDRVTDASGRIADLPWSEVRQARIAGREPIPRLDELLEAFPDACFNIDAKHDEVVEPLTELVARMGVGARVCLASFVDRRVTEMRRRLPGVVTSPGARGVARLRAGTIARPSGVASECVQVPPAARGITLVTHAFVQRMHRMGIHVHVWTIDDPDEMHVLLDLGVDGIMTDRIEVLKQVLVDRGTWHHPPEN